MVDRVATREEQIEAAQARGDQIQAAALANSERVTVPHLELRDLPFSAVPLFGYDHCNIVSSLGFDIGSVLGLPQRELEAIKLAGLLHDAGRTRPWQFAEPGHQKVSADLAVRALRGAGNTHGNDWLRDRVEFLILSMDLSAKELPRDPALQVLWDVDALEAARLAPGTPEGLRVFRERTRRERLCTQIAFDRRRDCLHHYGWPGM